MRFAGAYPSRAGAKRGGSLALEEEAGVLEDDLALEHGIDDLRVELGAPAGVDDLLGLGVGEGGLVDTFGGQGVVDVHHADDPGFERDGGAAQTGG